MIELHGSLEEAEQNPYQSPSNDIDTDPLSAGSTTVVVRVHALEVTYLLGRQSYPTQRMLDRIDAISFRPVRYV